MNPYTFPVVATPSHFATTAETLHAHNVTNVQSAAQAADALKPFAGHFASAIFALGFIGSGLLAIPVLAGSGSVESDRSSMTRCRQSSARGLASDKIDCRYSPLAIRLNEGGSPPH
jgi:Mn2+/Fe2+ NRAMP family transporter